MERHVFYLQASFTSKAVGKYLRSHGPVCQSAAPVLQENRDFPRLEGRFSFFRPMKHFRYSCYFSLKRVSSCVRKPKMLIESQSLDEATLVLVL